MHNWFSSTKNSVNKVYEIEQKPVTVGRPIAGSYGVCAYMLLFRYSYYVRFLRLLLWLTYFVFLILPFAMAAGWIDITHQRRISSEEYQVLQTN